MNPEEIQSVYLAARGYEGPLESELEGVFERFGRLRFSPHPARPVFWAQNVWQNPRVLPIASINDAARKLKALQRNWIHTPVTLHRRSALIRDKLPPVSGRPLNFPAPLPTAPLGSWTLLDASTLLASPQCSSPFPNGEVHFVEDRAGPPNRAYLKLWEALTLMERHPVPGEFCLDAGGAPGGWAWVAARLGARVLTVDRSPPHPTVGGLPEVEYRRGDAFRLRPEDFEPVDWLFWDVVCYPEKLYDWLAGWVFGGKARHVVATLKFQGAPDYTIARRFAAFPHSRVTHLFHNKHELTLMISSPFPAPDSGEGE